MREVAAFIQIINMLAQWIVNVIKHYRIVLGMLLVLTLIVDPYPNHFPWIPFLIVLFFIYKFYRKKSKTTVLLKEQQRTPQETMHIENNNFINIENVIPSRNELE